MTKTISGKGGKGRRRQGQTGSGIGGAGVWIQSQPAADECAGMGTLTLLGFSRERRCNDV
ncbi:hypothetical protein [Lonsdalea iberica]|uniref:hypothetical protein n=1 Tax=Lonsdalea iberica TaxID=1082703 RepID=UPI00111BE7EA|nr:hypothetical protein [Lonsdalea iberica]